MSTFKTLPVYDWDITFPNGVDVQELEHQNIIPVYDWNKTISFDAGITAVFGARTIGKTYGLRKQGILDFLKRGHRYVEVHRTKEERKQITPGIFDKIIEQNEFPDLTFKVEGMDLYVARKVLKTEKPEWQHFGYSVALTEQERLKKVTFANVRRIVMDEAVIDRSINRHARYLPNEWNTLARLISTISRERPGYATVKPRVYLLGNAVDIANPFFMRYNINQVPKPGYHWYENKTALLHIPNFAAYGREMQKRTVAGQMAGNTIDAQADALNIFKGSHNDYVERKTPDSVYQFAIVYRGQTIGAWFDMPNSLVFISKKTINDGRYPTYTLTTSDNRVNMVMAKKNNTTLKMLSEMYGYGFIRYETPALREFFAEIMRNFGYM